MIKRNRVGAFVCFALSISFIIQHILNSNGFSEIQATIWAAIGTLLLFGLDG